MKKVPYGIAFSIYFIIDISFNSMLGINKIETNRDW